MNSASFSPDGTRIVTASWDNTARVWDAATGEQLLVLRGHEFIVYSASFSPDGKRIVTGHDSTIRIWDSVPYAQRYQQKQEYEKAEPKAVRVLDVVMATAPQRDGIPDLRAVAESIRIDSAIDESVRHVALNLLMRRADNIQSKARKLIYGLENYFVLAADIQVAVQSDASHEPAVHAAAIRIARWIEDSPHRLNDGAWRIVDDDDRSPADYERAQRAAASAFQSDPTSLNFARTLAKAWTRLQQPDKAIEVWREHVDTRREDNPQKDSSWANALLRYGKALLKNNQAADAEPVLREGLSICEIVYKKGHRRIAEARRVLGECLTKLAQFTEAETILVELANAVLEDDAATESRTAEAIQRVVDLYKAWHEAEPDPPEADYDAKAAQWRAKMGEEGTEASRQQGTKEEESDE
ncbi:MAG: PD40 domain-containing protein [Planctomycetes bacterium]|nr:PD40 domain-containing protein [Planctomycetota bacterium]